MVATAQASLFPAPELPVETRIALSKLPPDEELGPVEPDSDMIRNIEGMGVYNRSQKSKEIWV